MGSKIDLATLNFVSYFVPPLRGNTVEMTSFSGWQGKEKGVFYHIGCFLQKSPFQQIVMSLRWSLSDGGIFFLRLSLKKKEFFTL